MKRLIFCFDGTWNKLDAPNPTNVVFTAESITPTVQTAQGGVEQIIHYDEGVGTSKCERVLGGLAGYGLSKNLLDAYRFLIFNYSIGDEIYVFGFSRGAYSARSFVGMVRNCGILQRKYAGKSTDALKLYQSRKPDDKPDSVQTNRFRQKYGIKVCVSDIEDEWKTQNVEGYKKGGFERLKIKYLGVWDTVGALGVPTSLAIAPLINKKYLFHDTRLTGFVESARHAVAIDENRKSFAPTLWTNFDALNERVSAP